MKTVALLILVFTLASERVLSCPTSGDCRPSKVVLDSDVLGGQILIVTGGKRRPGNQALVDLLEFRDGAWQSTGKIETIDRGYFTWLDIPPGDYMLVATLTGYSTAKVNVHVRKRHGRLNRINIPLKTDDCVPATLRRSRS